jgi:heterodisulfide reductase subunit A
MEPSYGQKQRNHITGAVMVVGGGVGGIQAALDLADSGYYVYLVESSPAIGGVMARLDKTFPTNDCSMCILSPKLVECGRHHNIEIITCADVLDAKGEPGNFQVQLRKRPRYIDTELCTGCGICQTKCPQKVVDASYGGRLGTRKAIYIPYPQAVPKYPVIDRENCIYFLRGKCKACEIFCPNGAIKFDQEEQLATLHVGAIILAPGFSAFDAGRLPQYGYGRFPNVVTSMEFERILNASGPFSGEVLRPSDKQAPKKIAWIQCVGSRGKDPEHSYCSSVCCTYAIKEAVVAMEHNAAIEAAIFFIDMRTFGKGFEAYFNRARDESGVRMIRCRPPIIEQVEESGDIRIRYEDENGKLVKEDFNLAVLSVGLEPAEDAKLMAERLGLKLDRHGFCQSEDFSPVVASRPGVFVCGAFQAPKDIPETVMQASAAAAGAAGLLSPARGSLVQKKEYPPVLDIKGQPPRIGVFVCNCGINIGGVVDVGAVKDYAATLPGVVYAEENLYSCSQDTQEKIRQAILEHKLNRVVVASCTPRTHEPLFQETMREVGLNRHLFEMANIRDQCSWVHREYPEAATEKAKVLTRMATAKARLVQPIEETYLSVNNAALVIGGGVAGVAVALKLSEQGYPVYLLEKTGQLGGIARRIKHTPGGADVQAFLQDLIDRLNRDANIQIFTQAEIIESTGYVGNFTTRVAYGSHREMVDLDHGVVIIATGGKEYHPQDYLYGQDPRVMTLLEMEEKISNGGLDDVRTAVLIQCVGSREPGREYCSRICCGDSLKCALALKDFNPNIDVFILYRDMRAYGLLEDLFTEAKDRGIKFIRYDLDNRPVVDKVAQNGRERLAVSLKDHLLQEQLVIQTDLLALAVATLPGEDNKRISQLFKVPLNGDGFFLEAHMKLRPVDFATEGVFLCGLAHGPKFISDSIVQAQAAAARASMILSQHQMEVGGLTASVDKARCSGCGVCVQLCPYKAIDLDPKLGVAVINPALCKGCGVCVSSCVCGAATLAGFTDAQLFAMIESV